MAKSKPTTKKEAVVVPTKKRVSKRAAIAVELSPLQILVNKIADTRLDEIEADFIEQEMIEEGERHEKGNEIYRLFKLWREQMTDLDMRDNNYFRLKELFIATFDENEFTHWLYGNERYLQKILWNILKLDGFCEAYKIRKVRTLKLMEEYPSWKHFIQTWGSDSTKFID